MGLCLRSLFQSQFIALLHPSLGVSRRHTGPKLMRSNRGYPWLGNLTECIEEMTVPSRREPKIAASMDELLWSEPSYRGNGHGTV
jgi:hypothetical protein